MAEPNAALREIAIADDASAWTTLGFAVARDACDVGGIRLRFVGRDAGEGIVGWALAGLRATELDGLATTAIDDAEAPAELPVDLVEHANGAVAVDHVVVFTPDLDRTADAFVGAGLDLRRRRGADEPGPPVRMAFFRAGPTIVEVAEHRGDRAAPAAFWGLTLVVRDVDAAAAALGERLGDVRPAVQPGRRIATVRAEAGISVPLALITPR